MSLDHGFVLKKMDHGFGKAWWRETAETVFAQDSRDICSDGKKNGPRNSIDYLDDLSDFTIFLDPHSIWVSLVLEFVWFFTFGSYDILCNIMTHDPRVSSNMAGCYLVRCDFPIVNPKFPVDFPACHVDSCETGFLRNATDDPLRYRSVLLPCLAISYHARRFHLPLVQKL